MLPLRLSTLELATICQGATVQQAIQRAVEGAQVVEQLGYHRLWLAEHHNMPHIASSATALLIGHIAGQTQHMRIGSGGIMLPNHSPLIVAEQFGTLESIYPGRIDLGLGRAPGTDQLTAAAIRRHNLSSAQYFKEDILSLQQYFDHNNQAAKVRAFPGEGCDIPLYILGSSTDSAYLAAELGLPYAFAAHFAPNLLGQASQIYHNHFQASTQCEKPYFITCVNIVAADSNEEAQFLASSLKNLFAGIITDDRQPLSPPTEHTLLDTHPELAYHVQNMLRCTFIGDGQYIKEQVTAFAKTYHVAEIMTTNYIFDQSARHHAFNIIAQALMK